EVVSAPGLHQAPYADAAVAPQDRAGDGPAVLPGGEQDVEAGVVLGGGQEPERRHRLHEVVDAGHAAQGDPVEPEALRAPQVGAAAAGGDAVDPHLGGELVGHLGDEAPHGVLGGGVEGAAPGRVEGGVGQCVDHAAPGLDQFREGGLGAEDVALHVDAEHLVEQLG